MDKIAVSAEIDGSSAHTRKPILDSGGGSQSVSTLFSMFVMSSSREANLTFSPFRTTDGWTYTLVNSRPH